MLIRIFLTIALSLVAFQAHSGDSVIYDYDGDFEDATFAVESAIIDRGLVIDYVSHVGEMLKRTAADVGSDTVIFENADIFVFCSAVLSRQVMEIEPMNVVHCPFGIFVADDGENVVIGHRTYPDGAMKKVEALLRELAQEAASF